MSSMLSSLPQNQRRILLALWVGFMGSLWFIALPEGAGWLSERLGWPTLVVPGGRAAGYVLLACALGLLLYCSRAFVRLGKGTIVPIDAPRSLVRTGIYRFSRNPIYVGYVAILVADFIRNGQLGRLIYVLIFFACIQAMIVFLEEPGLRKRFGSEWNDYAASVPRWLGPRTSTSS